MKLTLAIMDYFLVVMYVLIAKTMRENRESYIRYVLSYGLCAE